MLGGGLVAPARLRPMASISGKRILSAIVIVILLATLPGGIRRIVQTRELYLFALHFFPDIAARDPVGFGLYSSRSSPSCWCTGWRE